MDYTGFGKDGKHNYKRDYKINRSLTEKERQGKLEKSEVASEHPLDWMSVIKLNNTFLELVDRWYPVKGFAAWQGVMISTISMGGLVAFLWLAMKMNELGFWIFSVITTLVFSFFIWVGYRGLRFDVFRSTHYPIRLNRKTRQVHVFRPRDKVLTTSWDDLFVCVMENDMPLFDKSFDIRAHVLDEDGETVRDTFTLGYAYMGDKESILQLWEYIRRYMEETNGVEENYKLTELCLPIDGRREGVAFGILRTFAPAANRPIPQLLLSPIAALIILGRWFAMYTCKVPRWPEEVEAACQVDPDDPYQKDWRDNGKYDFWELGWPLICFVVGLAVLGVGITLLIRAAF